MTQLDLLSRGTPSDKRVGDRLCGGKPEDQRKGTEEQQEMMVAEPWEMTVGRKGKGSWTEILRRKKVGSP